MKRPTYSEGDWFAVPIGRGGQALGIVARANPKGVVMGYFFGPRLHQIPDLAAVTRFKPENAVLAAIFGDQGLRQRRWIVIGRAEGWRREAWPIPVFVRHEELTGRSYRVHYDPDDPNRVVNELLIPPGVDEYGPSDDLFGALALEKVLARMM